MAVKIRLTRIGRHKDALYRIVVADARFARDARIIEQIGYYDPNKGIEKADVDEEKALKWLKEGAMPSDTVRALLGRKGILSKFNELKGKKK